jgi:hypothetical protein
VLSLKNPSNLSEVNKRKHEEVRTAVEKAITMLDKEENILDLEDAFDELLGSKRKRKSFKPMKKTEIGSGNLERIFTEAHIWLNSVLSFDELTSKNFVLPKKKNCVLAYSGERFIEKYLTRQKQG